MPNRQRRAAHAGEVIRRWIAFADAGFNGDFLQFFSSDYIGHLSSETTISPP